MPTDLVLEHHQLVSLCIVFHDQISKVLVWLEASSEKSVMVELIGGAAGVVPRGRWMPLKSYLHFLKIFSLSSFVKFICLS